MSVKTKGPRSGVPVAVVPRKENDGRIDVFFNESGLEAWGNFFPPSDGGAPISQSYVDAVIANYRLFHGIQRQPIDEAVRLCNELNQPVNDVLMARGDPPVHKTPEYIRLNPALIPDPSNEASRFIVVKKDQVLARTEPHKPGKEGKNIHGEPIPCGSARPAGVKGGENTRTEGRFILSEIDGQLIQTENVINVRPNLEIKGSVGRQTSNIVFPGDVYIDGAVNDGFKLYSGGSIVIKQTFDVSDAISKGDLTVSGGIVGRGAAQVKAGGSLKTRSIENCRIACRKSVVVSAEIINSSIFCLDTVDASKGRILGGEIWAVNGVRAGALTKISGRSPKIHCGVDFSIEQEKEKYNNMLRILSAKLGKLRQMLGDATLDGSKKAKLEELRSRLEEDQKKTSTAISEIMGNIATNESAVVEVLGEITTGTLIEICQTALFVTEPLTRVKIKLDKKEGKLLVDSLY